MKYIKRFTSIREAIGSSAYTPATVSVADNNSSKTLYSTLGGSDVELEILGTNLDDVRIGIPTNTILYKAPSAIGLSGAISETQNSSGWWVAKFENDITSIGSSIGFKNSNVTSVLFSEAVTSIGSSAFSGCSSLTSVTISSSVTRIENYAFNGCSSLTSITIPNSVARIENYVFNGCSSLTSITIPNSVRSIGNYAFAFCSTLTSITIPNSVRSIGSNTFNGCSSLISITIPNSVSSIGQSAFWNCSSLTSITIPNSVTSIGYEVLAGCDSLTSIVVESGNTIYDSRDNCNAIIETASNTLIAGCQSTIIPESVTSIGGYAFRNCISLSSIAIPNSVTSIGDYAFGNCGLSEVYYSGTTSQWWGIRIASGNDALASGSGTWIYCIDNTINL